jgi:23S rRNA (uracil1939-C5)-methyltransferase
VPKKSRLPTEIFAAHIDTLANDARGVAHLAGKAVFIPDALPGEEISFRYTARRKTFDEGRLEAVHNPSPDRIEPRCPHFGLCGGCRLQHLDAEQQMVVKQSWLLDNLARIGKVNPEQILKPLTGPHWSYRHRARLGVKYVRQKGKVLVGFRERNSTYVADLQSCAVLHQRVGRRLVELGQLVRQLSLYQQLPQIEVAVGDKVVALNFRVLAPPNVQDKALLAAFGKTYDFHIYLQPQGPESVYRLWPTLATALSYRLPAYQLELVFAPFHFTQINPFINQQMVDWTVRLLDLQEDERVLDLFCGIGNFTLPLARRSLEVVGIEGDASAVAWARHNAQRNAITNVRFITVDLSRDVAVASWLREHNYNKILLDPPRCGALTIVPQIGRLAAQRIVYVSCHPATLARDAGELVHRFGYRLASVGVMDMFPHTAHVEAIALFVRS